MAPKVRQISVLLENRVGRLMEVAKTIGNEAINIQAISVVDASDFGLVRLILDDPDKALEAFRRIGVVAIEQEVLAVELENLPGSLARLLSLLTQAELNVQYTYGLFEKSDGNAVIILRTADAEGAATILQDAGLRLLSHDDVQRLNPPS